MKPILFSTEMIQAILEGRKTMTRRVIKPQPPVEAVYSYISEELISEKLTERFVTFADGAGKTLSPQVMIPYQPGDILWVRETWQDMWILLGESYAARMGRYAYKADYLKEKAWWEWRPSVHMPKEAARIFLRITDVRVERLQEITWKDAKREGMFEPYVASETGYETEMRGQFRDYWDYLNAKRGYGWDNNPWVWVIEFERTEVESWKPVPCRQD